MIGTGLALLGSAALGLGGSVLSANAANKAAKVQAQAAGKAAALQAPFTNAGQGAVTTLGQLFGIDANGQQTGQADFSNFFQSPDYQFALQQGTQALNNSSAAKGMLQSGNYLKDLTSFGQGLATQNFGNYVNQLMQLSSLGQNAASGQGNQIGNQGQAQASGIVGSANALNQGLSGVGNSLALYGALNGSQSAYANNPAQANLYSPQAWGASIVPAGL